MKDPVDNLRHILGSHHVPEIHYRRVNSYPHDPLAFTEGLVFHNETLYESAMGHRTRTVSTLRQVEIGSGRILKWRSVPASIPQHRAEGLAIFKGKLFQLTYLTGKCFVYDLETFDLLNMFSYSGEGWGLTDDGEGLIMSNGTTQLQFIDPETFDTLRTLEVQIDDEPLCGLNELEYIDGYIYANVWTTDYVFRINPETGKAVGRMDLSALRPDETKDCDECVLNGMAYDQRSEHLFVTGKEWPTLFEIRLMDAAQVTRDFIARDLTSPAGDPPPTN